MLKSDVHFKQTTFGAISGVRRDVFQICARLGYYTAHNGNLLPTITTISCVQARNYHYSLRPGEELPLFPASR
jgi:hypothetical protein